MILALGWSYLHVNGHRTPRFAQNYAFVIICDHLAVWNLEMAAVWFSWRIIARCCCVWNIKLYIMANWKAVINTREKNSQNYSFTNAFTTPNIWLTVTKNAFVGSALKVRMLLKCAAIHYLKSLDLNWNFVTWFKHLQLTQLFFFLLVSRHVSKEK